ncbi:hypothetical protein JOD01_001033 [Brevibacillus fulvus]|uniref:Uncharacterized protein n=1 Tax=Brevibacillus fulvus TaxID=1125967 RepID=A0A938Y1H2_9BACL|nr:hypothetical protein [Brevibacillus fulvus]
MSSSRRRTITVVLRPGQRLLVKARRRRSCD